MQVSVRTKSCMKCGNNQSISSFYKDKSRIDSLTEQCKTCKKRTNKIAHLSNYKSIRNRSLIHKFGITYEQYEEMANKQSNHCYICLIHRDKLKRDFAVDHDHITGQIRGLLCMSCNTTLGQVQDSTEILQRMIDYLKRFGAKNVKTS